MILIDTCAWIEWLVNGKLASQFTTYFNMPENILVPTLIQFELYKWICREKDEATAMEVIAITEQGKVIPLDTSIALYAAELAGQHQLAAADSIIYATSQLHQAILITCDQHFENLNDVKYFSKK